MLKYDWIIRRGRVIDPANGIDGVRDVALSAGKIAVVAESLDPAQARQVFDATGKLVTPGLIDIHMHGYDAATPLGIDPDHYCLGRAVTTAVDAGSAGCDTFPGLRRYVMERCRTRLLAFLHISRTGLSFAGLGGDGDVPGELDSLRLANPVSCVRSINANRDVIVGVKIRLSDSIAAGGATEHEAYARARAAAQEVGLPLMVHHNFSTVSMEDCPGQMARGDIYTHMYHGFPNCIINPETRRLEPAAIAAREKGVLFDIGHGQGSFSWNVGELCAEAGFWPDTISTDLHRGSCEGPGYDLATVMTRILHLGMPLVEVIRGVTSSAAKSIGWDDRIGTLSVGREADVSVLELRDVDMKLEDTQAQLRRIRQRFVPVAVWRAGEPGTITAPREFPNRPAIEARRSWWPRLVIRDESLPAS